MVKQYKSSMNPQMQMQQNVQVQGLNTKGNANQQKTNNMPPNMQNGNAMGQARPANPNSLKRQQAKPAEGPNAVASNQQPPQAPPQVTAAAVPQDEQCPFKAKNAQQQVGGGRKRSGGKSSPKKKTTSPSKKKSQWRPTSRTHFVDGVARKVYVRVTDGVHAVKRKVGDRFVYRKI